MKNKCIRQICLTAFLYFTSCALYGQINPYQRLTDPLAITYIDSLYPQKFSSGISPSARNIQDSGSGIITHIWLTFDWTNPGVILDDTINIWIDDKLVISETLDLFSKNNHGLLRAPLDTMMSGGIICNVQMAYQSKFRIYITSNSPPWCLFWAVSWRPLPLEITPPRFTMDTTTELALQQKIAEDAWERRQPEYSVEMASAIQSKSMKYSDTLLLADINKSGIISAIHLKLDSYKDLIADSLILQIFWDNSPYPAVDVPVSDFFLVSDSLRNITSYYIHASIDSGLTAYFPMPFAVNAHLRLINRGRKNVKIESKVEYFDKKIDIQKHGYFFAQFNSIDKAKYKVYHQVAKTRGQGRYIGTIMDVRQKGKNLPTYLEGNPHITIDSMPKNYMEYPGTEDYFNGGWYFFDGAFALPFAGCPTHLKFMYRFHCLDAIDFKKSLDIDWEHGVSNDFPAPYRTVGLFYKQWTRYWTNTDTIVSDQTWQIAGSGYDFQEQVIGKLNGVEIFSAQCDDKGAFKITTTVSDIFKAGLYDLEINNEKYTHKIAILNSPLMYCRKDSLPHGLYHGDTLAIIGKGFALNENIKLYVNGIHCGSAKADSSYSFQTYVTIPQIDTGYYHVEGVTSNGLTVLSLNTFFKTRTLNYEIEDMTVKEMVSGVGEPSTSLGYWSYEKWSQQNAFFFYPDSGGHVTFIFSLPDTDTFRLSTFLTMGSRYGQYEIQIDSIPLAYFDGYVDLDFGHPIRSPEILIDSSIFLKKGNHTITFKSVGKNPKGFEYSLLADNIILKPITTFKKTDVEIPQDTLRAGFIYPNPFSKSADKNVTFMLQDECSTTDKCLYSISCSDILGKVVFKTTAEAYSGKLAIPMSSLPVGAYFYTLLNQHTGSAITYSVILVD
ncbi:MAG: DUF2961 domain-containing protein [Bacteroidota bacterium]